MKSTFRKYDPPRFLLSELEGPAVHHDDLHVLREISDADDALLALLCDALERDIRRYSTHALDNNSGERNTPLHTIYIQFRKAPFNLGKANNWTFYT